MTRAELAARLDAWADSGRRGDDDLNPGLVADRSLTPAAVLVPLIEHPQGYTVLLTRRAENLRDHAGQISFPGGRVEPNDTTPEATALREAEEEVGLTHGHVDVLGRLDRYHTGTGFRVIPVVGVVSPVFEPRLDAVEVAEVFEVPLAFVLDRANHRRHTRRINGTTRHFHALPFEERDIWGATAGMLVNLVDALGR